MLLKEIPFGNFAYYICNFKSFNSFFVKLLIWFWQPWQKFSMLTWAHILVMVPGYPKLRSSILVDKPTWVRKVWSSYYLVDETGFEWVRILTCQFWRLLNLGSIQHLLNEICASIFSFFFQYLCRIWWFLKFCSRLFKKSSNMALPKLETLVSGTWIHH